LFPGSPRLRCAALAQCRLDALSDVGAPPRVSSLCFKVFHGLGMRRSSGQSLVAEARATATRSSDRAGFGTAAEVSSLSSLTFVFLSPML
jgi:hypothetical protein